MELSNSTLEFLQAMASLNSPIERFVLEHGRPFPEPSANDPHLPTPTTARQCYRNAYMMAEHTGLVYCEGFARNILPVPHAWVWDPETNRTYDPTWELRGTEYFGVAFDWNYVERTGKARGMYGVLDNLEQGQPLFMGHHTDFKYTE